MARVAQSNARAEAITSDHTAADIREDFDKRINQSMANVQNFLGASLRSLEMGRSPMPTDVRYRCKTESVEMGLVREDATADERKLRPPVALEDSDVSVRLHRSLLTSALEDPQLVQTLAPMLTRLLDALAKQDGGADSTLATRGKMKWTIDLDWLSLDFKGEPLKWVLHSLRGLWFPHGIAVHAIVFQ